MPLVTVLTCFTMIVQWLNPPVPLYAGEIPGVVYVDDAPRFLTVREYGLWTASMSLEDQIVNSGYVVTQSYPTAVNIENLPMQVYCNKIYLPSILN